jgi:chromosome segregation ATPase
MKGEDMNRKERRALESTKAKRGLALAEPPKQEQSAPPGAAALLKAHIERLTQRRRELTDQISQNEEAVERVTRLISDHRRERDEIKTAITAYTDSITIIQREQKENADNEGRQDARQSDPDGEVGQGPSAQDGAPDEGDAPEGKVLEE